MKKLAKIVIYFDYELQQGADMCSIKQNWGLDDYNQTEVLLKLFEKYNFKVCFATVGEIAKSNNLPYGAKNQILKIYNLGHEIASHSSLHFANTDLNMEDFKKDLIESKKLLESVIKNKVVTYVPPRNLPFNFLGFSIKILRKFNFNFLLPSFNYRLNKLYSLLNKSGYQVYREYDLLFNMKSKIKKNLVINKLDLTGFDQNTINYIDKNKFKKNIITIYGHPHSLISNSNQSLKNLINFCNYLKDNEFKVILPREIKKCLEKN